MQRAHVFSSNQTPGPQLPCPIPNTPSATHHCLLLPSAALRIMAAVVEAGSSLVWNRAQPKGVMARIKSR